MEKKLSDVLVVLGVVAFAIGFVANFALTWAFTLSELQSIVKGEVTDEANAEDIVTIWNVFSQTFPVVLAVIASWIIYLKVVDTQKAIFYTLLVWSAAVYMSHLMYPNTKVFMPNQTAGHPLVRWIELIVFNLFTAYSIFVLIQGLIVGFGAVFGAVWCTSKWYPNIKLDQRPTS